MVCDVRVRAPFLGASVVIYMKVLIGYVCGVPLGLVHLKRVRAGVAGMRLTFLAATQKLRMFYANSVRAQMSGRRDVIYARQVANEYVWIVRVHRRMRFSQQVNVVNMQKLCVCLAVNNPYGGY